MKKYGDELFIYAMSMQKDINDDNTEVNMNNNREVYTDLSGKTIEKPCKSQKGATPPANELQIDQFLAKVYGGAHRYRNAQILARSENIAQWMKFGKPMADNCYKINLKIDQLWNGCILASIAHAIMVAHYPLISNEHSWDRLNYNIRNNAGVRGTVSFSNGFCTAAFRNDNCDRLNSENLKPALMFFQNAPKKIIELAEAETLHYLLDNVDGQVLPVITAAFWGSNNELFTVDSSNDFLQYGGSLLSSQTLDYDFAVYAWKAYYGMSQSQVRLMKSIYDRKIEDPLIPIFLTLEEIEMIGTRELIGLAESLTSFQEIGIYWETVVLD